MLAQRMNERDLHPFIPPLLVLGSTVFLGAVVWFALYVLGRHVALRERLSQADAIVAVAGTGGTMENLQGKILTAVHLYRHHWAPWIVFTGKFSEKVSNARTPMPLATLHEAVAHGRIKARDIDAALAKWDAHLDARYMQQEAEHRGVPPSAILVETEALHTGENAAFVARMLLERNMHRIILVSAPFHQRRTYLTFLKYFRPHGISIINYRADTADWHPLTWFFSRHQRALVWGELQKIRAYRERGDIA